MIKKDKHLKRLFLLLILSICVSFVLCIAGCKVIDSIFNEDQLEETIEHPSDAAAAGMRQTTLYFETDDGLMVPVIKLLPWEEGIGRAALSQLVDSEENKRSVSMMGLRSVVPQGVTFVLSISDDAVATLNVQNLPELESAHAEQAFVCAVVNTLTEFPTIEKVSLKFDGKTVKKLPNGTKVNDVKSKIPLNTEPLAVTAGEDEVLNNLTLYYPNQAASLYVPVTRLITKEVNLETALKELFAGPSNTSLRNCFPEDIKLLSAEIIDNNVVIDVSGEFNALKDNPVMEGIAVDIIKLTASNFGVVDSINIKVEGQDYISVYAEENAATTLANMFIYD